MGTRVIRQRALLIGAGVSVAFFLTSPAPLTRRALSASASIVISQFRTRGPNGGNDEFIELYNLSTSVVPIGGWRIQGSDGSGTVSTRVIISPGAVLNSGCHYLLTNSNPTGGPYSGAVRGDQTYGVGITDDGGIALEAADGTIVDQVGMSASSTFKEGSPLQPLTSDTNAGYERLPGSAAGSGQDTDNNQLDFRLITPSLPRGIVATCASIPGGGLAGLGFADPAAVNLGGTTLLTVRVRPGDNPPSSGLAVSADLTSIGGAKVQAFFDDGTNGDATAGDGTFSYQTIVPITTPPVGKSIPVTITDAQSRTAGTLIGLAVVGEPQCGPERWTIKTGADFDTRLVDLSSDTPTTIAAMRSWPAPSPIPEMNRVFPYETTIWDIDATLVQYKLEDDQDYHLVLSDDAGNTIIAEIPCTCCVSFASPFRTSIFIVRRDFDAKLKATTSFQTANIPVRISGVGMFDFIHGQTGVAPNGIELHPVIALELNADLTQPAVSFVQFEGKRMLVFGLGFDDGAVVFLNGEKQKTANDSSSPTTTLVCKKAGKLVAPGQEVTIQVRDANGKVSFPLSVVRTPGTD